MTAVFESDTLLRQVCQQLLYPLNERRELIWILLRKSFINLHGLFKCLPRLRRSVLGAIQNSQIVEPLPSSGSLSQRAMPDWAKGRMNATMTMVAQAATALGGIIWGLAAHHAGVVPTFLGAATPRLENADVAYCLMPKYCRRDRARKAASFGRALWPLTTLRSPFAHFLVGWAAGSSLAGLHILVPTNSALLSL